MELDERKLRILQAIIDDYIHTASPVGSRTISKRSDISLSSATIRNEMSDLEELGFLEQPHTSSGRIPSDKAYRLYVDTLMSKPELTSDEMHEIRDKFTDAMDEVEDVIKQTARVLSSLTNYTSMVLTPQLHSIKLMHIQIVPVTEGKALLVIVTDAGIAKDSIIKTPKGITPKQLEELSRMLTDRLKNKRLDEINEVMLSELAAEIGDHKEFLNSLMDLFQKSIKPDNDSVELSGAMNMLNFPEYNDVDKAKNFLATIETKDILCKTLKDATKLEFSITIGNENENPEMKDCSIVTATYKIGDNPIGSLGVIGPTRMDYGRVMSILGYMGKSLSEILTGMVDDGENDKKMLE